MDQAVKNCNALIPHRFRNKSRGVFDGAAIVGACIQCGALAQEIGMLKVGAPPPDLPMNLAIVSRPTKASFVYRASPGEMSPLLARIEHRPSKCFPSRVRGAGGTGVINERSELSPSRRIFFMSALTPIE